MPDDSCASSRRALMAALSAGALWGIFEATVGYFLHLLPFSIGFLVWYPAACFFLVKSCRESGKTHAVLLTAALASAVKLFNLTLPGRIDKVINPAASIIFEGLSVFIACSAFCLIKSAYRGKTWVIGIFSLGANSLWRLMYTAYLAFIVPQWMRDASVIRSADTLFRFLVADNLAGGAVVWAGYFVLKRLRGKPAPSRASFLSPSAKPLGVAVLLAADIGLQLFLK